MTSGTTAGTVTFSQPGDANYNAATAVVETKWNILVNDRTETFGLDRDA